MQPGGQQAALPIVPAGNVFLPYSVPVSINGLLQQSTKLGSHLSYAGGFHPLTLLSPR